MNTSSNWLQAKGLLLDLAASFASAMKWPSSITIVAESENVLELKTSFRHIFIDKLTKEVVFNAYPVARLEAIQSIGIKCCRGNKGLEWWVVSLNFGRQRRLDIGRSFNDAEASIAAARVASFTGKHVLLLR